MSTEIQELAALRRRLGRARPGRDHGHAHRGHGVPPPRRRGARRWTHATRAAFAAAASQWPDIRFVKTRVYIGDGRFVGEYQMIATADGKKSRAMAST